MNDTEHIDVQTCITGLKEAILDVLASKRKEERLGSSDIADRTGIRHQFKSEVSLKWIPSFTRTILIEMQDEGRVKQHGKGPGSFWELTKKEYNNI